MFTRLKQFTRVTGFVVFFNTVNRANCLIFALFATLFFTSSAEAVVTGPCYNCHTMHNSQGGSAVAKDDSGSLTVTPYGSLLIYSCVGCHSKTDAATWKDSFTNAPIVLNTNEPTYGAKGLAAGNFYYVSGTTDNTGHNVFSNNPDNTPPALGNTPPGGTALTAQLRCAGTWGCHGHNGRQGGDTAVDDQTGAMKGAHHGDDTPPLAASLTDVSKNYRFLLGIKGKEDSDWEYDNTNTSHNEYQGSTSSATNTISYLCGECHGKFHTWIGGASEVGTASPWLRHPTDILLPSDASKEYKNYTSYSMVAPLARPDPDNVANTTVVTPGTDIIMCLSCHRAHASPYFKMMRWDYKSSSLSTALSGCNVCHTSKN
jgi:hypothetical protein